MRTLGYWTGAAVELLSLPFREGPGLAFFWFLFCVVELWILLHMVSG